MGIDVKGVLAICLLELLVEPIVPRNWLDPELLVNSLNLERREGHISNLRLRTDEG